ncbi:MAG: hypothetical protein OCD02_05730 [Spirochaetaceae bacterium]
MNLKVLFLIFVFFLSLGINSLEVGIEGGYSYFEYAEVGPNNKDDLYSIKSGLVGLFIKKDIFDLELITSIKAQLPFDLIFTDALGTDETNYLDSLYYYGLNAQLGFLCPIKLNNLIISPGILLNYDYFYFKESLSEPYTEYSFSILGIGGELNLYLPLEQNIYLGIKSSGVLNLLPLNERSGDLLWSYNILTTLFISFILQ